MTLNNALEFIDRIRNDNEFRKEGYLAANPVAFRQWMTDSGYVINCGEIWDAFRIMLLKVTDEIGADEVNEIRLWYSILSGEDEETKNCNSCNSICTK